MASQEHSDGRYRVIEADSEGEFLLLHDVEGGERIRVERTDYNTDLQQEIDELRPGYLIRGVFVGDPETTAPRTIEHLEVRSSTSLYLTDEVDEVPIAVADDIWAQFDGDGSVVTTVNSDGSVVYELELFPKEREGVNVFEEIQSGEWSLEPWFDSLPTSSQQANHLVVVDPQNRPYTAFVGFPESHQAYDDLRERLRDAESRYRENENRSSIGTSEKREQEPSSTTQRNGSDTNPTPPSDNDAEKYTIKNVTVQPAPTQDPAAYKYSDLEPGTEGGIKALTLHSIYWTVYLTLVFPFQYIIRAFMWNFWKNWSTGFRLQIFASEAVGNVKKLKFFFNSKRRAVYLRASRLYTPAQLSPFNSGTAPISDDSSVERPPNPRNWDNIRRTVYERDGYCCVNCGRGGGSNGDAVLQADHVLPRSRGGSNELENLRTLCRQCHEARHGRTFD